MLKPYSETARLDAELILAYCLEVPRSWLYSHPEQEIPIAQEKYFLEKIKSRCQGVPIAYLLGYREFWSLNFKVTPDTLIPRPETELLVEIALNKAGMKENYVADLGTGAGAIALTLAHERPDWKLWATDCSEKAIHIAQQNAKNLNLNNVAFAHGHWCQALGSQKFHLIISNPPYLKNSDLSPEKKELLHEPRIALLAGEDGLEAITEIISQAKNYLWPGGWLILEHSPIQEEVHQTLIAEGYRLIEQHYDLSGQYRVTAGQYVCNT